MTDEEFLSKKIDELIHECATLQVKLQDALAENLMLKEENAKIPKLEAQVKALLTGNARLLEEKLRADGIAQRKAFDLIKYRQEDLDMRERIISAREQQLRELVNLLRRFIPRWRLLEKRSKTCSSILKQ